MKHLNLNDMKIRTRVTLGILAIVVTATAVTGAVAVYQEGQAIHDSAIKTKQAVLEARRDQMSWYLTSIQEDLLLVATNPSTLNGLKAFRGAWEQIEGDRLTYLQKHYIHDNPNPLGAKDKLVQAEDGSRYSAIHNTYHPWFRRLQISRGYYDVFLVDPKGELVYSVFKELDYATNLNTGQWKNTDIAKVFREAVENPREGYVAFTDFKPYGPSADAPASFIATPVIETLFDGSSSLAGVLIYQMPADRINAIFRSPAGLGETGDSFLVGADGFMQTNSRLSEEPTMLVESIDNEAVKSALEGKSGYLEVTDEGGIDLLKAYVPLEFNGVKWAALAQMELQELDEDALAHQVALGAVVAGLMLAAAIVAFLLARTIARPIVSLADTARELADRPDIDVPFLDRTDEIGELANAVEAFRLARIQRQEQREVLESKVERILAVVEAASNGDLSQYVETDGQESIDKVALGLRHCFAALSESLGEVNATALRLSEASSLLNETSEKMSVTANDSANNVQSVADAASSISETVNSVAAATEELSATSREIADSASNAADVAAQAVGISTSTDGTMRRLSESTANIGQILATITSIAEQTNLLALNATIEAARAGEAGKGFAVVANEVKELAKETASATEEISQRVMAIQSDSDKAVEAITDISQIIEQVNDIQNNIAMSVKEQTSATGEISNSIQTASAETASIVSNIDSVSDGSQQTVAGADQTLGAAAEMQEMARALRERVAQFKLSEAPDRAA